MSRRDVPVSGMPHRPRSFRRYWPSAGQGPLSPGLDPAGLDLLPGDLASGDGPGQAGAVPVTSQPGAEAALEALLAGARPVQADPAWQSVADVLAALTAPPQRAELTAGASVLAEFRARPRRRGRLGGARPGRRPVLTMLRSAGPATAVAASAAALGGLAAVAYAGDLPAPAQQLAHMTIGAPAKTAPQHDQPGSRTRVAATTARGGDGHHHHRAARTAGAPGSRPGTRDSAGWRHATRHLARASQGPGGTQLPGDPRRSGSPQPSDRPQPSGIPQPSGGSQPPNGSQPPSGAQSSASPQPSGGPTPTGGSQPGAKPSPSPQPDSGPTTQPGAASRPAVAAPP